ncbi:MAG: CinA family protein [Spirochaetales bacterium]|nr:CinA family protein [Spirochaetales bacterium]
MNVSPRALLRFLENSRLTLALAESCTGGLVSAQLTAQPGASRVLWGSWVTYSNDAKHRCLEVPQSSLELYGAVSREVALAMAEGALRLSGASLALSITGVAGPGPSEGVPEGTVWMGVAGPWPSEAVRLQIKGQREQIQRRSAEIARLVLLRWWQQEGRLDSVGLDGDN